MGQYEPVTEKDEKQTFRRYKRTPIEITKTITVANLDPGSTNHDGPPQGHSGPAHRPP
ncbi:MAG: hypothetical protein ACRDTJ_20180 [Pseudonocardiaceae bacterium]